MLSRGRTQISFIEPEKNGKAINTNRNIDKRINSDAGVCPGGTRLF